MSVINNVLKDLETRESRFIPIEIESIDAPGARVAGRRWWLIGAAVLCAAALALWQYLPQYSLQSASPVASEPAPPAPPPAVAVAVAPPVTGALAPVAEADPANRLIGLQVRESERAMRLEFALRERAVAYLKERGEDRFAYRLRDVESDIAAPRLSDNRFLADLEIVADGEGIDILFKTMPGILVETRQAQQGDESRWTIDLREPEAEPALVDEVAPAVEAAAKPIVPQPRPAALAEADPEPITRIETPTEPVAEAPVAREAAEVRVDIRATDPDAGAASRLEYATTLIQSRRYANAEALLRELLGGSSDYDARRNLLALYAHRQQHARLLRLARESAARYADDAGFRGEYARALLQQGAYRAVIDLLAGRDGLDASQHALLAAGYQRVDRHPDAIRHYEASLELEPRDARNWIGLAISQEHDGTLAQALRSYQAAALLGNLTPRLQAFVAKRSDTLERVLN